MEKKTSIRINELEIRIFNQAGEDYICLTDMAKQNSGRPEQVIQNWLRGRSVIEFLGLWERLSNPGFNHLEFEVIRQNTGLNTFAISVGDWATATGAIGIQATRGKYGGTYAHKDIAFEFGSWLSPSFKLLVIREFQRLKIDESARLRETLDWDLRRTLSKINYRFHTDAVQKHLIPPRFSGTKQQGVVFASEADLLNLALFGCTAREWLAQNADLRGNLRDHATTEQLLVLANLESLNAQLIRDGLAQDERLEKLNGVAIYQMELLVGSKALLALK